MFVVEIDDTCDVIYWTIAKSTQTQTTAIIVKRLMQLVGVNNRNKLKVRSLTLSVSDEGT